MSRGYVNVGIPPGMVREIRQLLKDGYLGYQSVAEVVKSGTWLWLVVLRVTRQLDRVARRPRSPDG